MLDEIMGKLSKEEKKYLNGLLMTDPLTLVGNRRKFDHDLRVSAKMARKAGYDITLILFDIDYFKKYNDQYGHPAGDQVLVEVATVIDNATKSFDMTHRYGGEEFSVLCPMTSIDQGMEIADRVRIEIEKHTPITVSGGVSNYRQTANSLKKFIKYADEGLYLAKDMGRNCIQRAY